MLERTEERFGLKPQRLAADSAYGSAPMLNWLVAEKRITPHIPVIDKSKREDGTFSREDFRYEGPTDTYCLPHRPARFLAAFTSAPVTSHGLSPGPRLSNSHGMTVSASRWGSRT
jgi:hypothetical protein